MKPIEIKNTETNDVYVLEFNRDTIKFAESRGFDVREVAAGKRPMSGIAELFWYAFRMHHPRVSYAEAEKMLFEDMGGLPEGFVDALVALYEEPFDCLLVKDDERKNSKLTVTL